MKQELPPEVILAAKGDLEFAMLLPAGVEKYWGQISPLLERALSYANGELVVDDLKPGVHFVIHNSRTDEIILAICVERVVYPNYECCQIVAIGGRGATKYPWAFDAFTGWAKYTGARYVQGWAHPAVARLWRRLGGKITYQMVRKELTCSQH